MKVSRATAWFDVYGKSLAQATLCLLPLKLSLTYGALIPLLTLWYCAGCPGLWQKCRSAGKGMSITQHYVLLLCIFLCAAPLGIRPLVSTWALLSLGFFSSFALVIAELTKRHGYQTFLLSLLTGQTAAALYSILYKALPLPGKNLFLGDVTEAGQLGITSVLMLGMLLFSPARRMTKDPAKWYALFLTVPLIPLSFAPELELTFWSKSLLFLTEVIIGFSFLRRYSYSDFLVPLLTLGTPLVTANLLLDLKRGPWFGVVSALLLLSAVQAPKLFFPILGSTGAVVALFPPVYQRIAASIDHFFISGGRSLIWSIGCDLAARFPIGIGYQNSAFLREFSTEIPPELRHFHNNFLNILVEGGWMALGAFLAWIFSIGKSVHSLYKESNEEQSFFALLFGAALLSWQLAGTVEYNFGDSEVMLIAFALIGFLLGFLKEECSAQSSSLNRLR